MKEEVTPPGATPKGGTPTVMAGREAKVCTGGAIVHRDRVSRPGPTAQYVVAATNAANATLITAFLGDPAGSTELMGR